MSLGTAGRRTQARSGGYYWDKTTLEQRRRTRLQTLERENYNSQPDFDSLPIIAQGESTTKRPGRPRSDYSLPKANTSTIVVGTADEGLKRVNRKETRQLAAQRRTFADILAKEMEDSAKNHQHQSETNTFHYLTCITAPTLGTQPAAASRSFCSICGYRGLYTCIDCGMRYCSLVCKSAHADTRCLKHVG
ncbi:Zinc finger HIT domain-containing protein 1 [Coemansia aciculifera]|uniref:Zinc finger HIT domain-containing protein 1 n=1 Tax=Coemansia aciculifera TaxID=417176 RepID=A0ACC1MA74_9FUNG|nr:Zinc finger HIT domain-containing protein 1 [Coemansia aciculifera]